MTRDGLGPTDRGGRQCAFQTDLSYIVLEYRATCTKQTHTNRHNDTQRQKGINACEVGEEAGLAGVLGGAESLGWVEGFGREEGTAGGVPLGGGMDCGLDLPDLSSKCSH